MVVHFTVPFHLAFLFFSRFNRKPRNGGSSCSTVRGQTCPGVEQLVQLLGPHISPSMWDSSCASLQRPARSATNLHVAWAAGKRGKSMGWGVGRLVWFYSLVPGCGIQNGAFDLFRTPYGNSVKVVPSGCPKGRECAATAPGDSAQCRPSEEFFLHPVEVATRIEPSN